MTTLKDLWEAKGLSSTQVAGMARISVPTLYKANRKQNLNAQILFRICNTLGITRAQYDKLEPCPRRKEFENE